MKNLLDSIYTSKFEELLSNVRGSVFAVDGEGNVIYINAGCSSLLEIPEEIILGKNVKDFVEEGWYTPSLSMQAIAKKELVWGSTVTRSGRELLTIAMPLFDYSGKVTLVITHSKEKYKIDEFIREFERERFLASQYFSELKYMENNPVDKEEIVHASKAMSNLLKSTKLLAKADSPVLLTGESGTGKELLAHFIHKNSKRSFEALIAVNCAAIPENLIEAELFGYAKGAFTGASLQGKAGLIELADKGTLFLDEIAELPLSIQSKLLRVLETHEIRRIGGLEHRKIDFRLITATNKNLKKIVDEHLFREDLYYRINVVPVEIPPLRDRSEDIILLANRFLEELNDKYKCQKFFAPKTIARLLEYDWPGNVRELRNVVERLLVTAPEDEIVLEEEKWFKEPQVKSMLGNANIFKSLQLDSLKDVMAAAEANYIGHVLELCNGDVQKAAKKLGIHRSVLYKKLAKQQEKPAKKALINEDEKTEQ